MITVAVYLHQRARADGAPDTYDPQLDDEFIHLIQHYPDTEEGWEDAYGWCEHAQDYLYEVHSVNNDSAYAVLITKGYALTPLPTRRPHYE